MQTYMTIRPHSTEKELTDSSVRLKEVLGSLGIVNRVMTYIFEVQGQGLVAASCFEAEDDEAMAKLQDLAGLPEGMVRQATLVRSEGAGAHGEKSMTTFVVNRGKVCKPDEVDSFAEQSEKAEQASAGDVKRMEVWLYDDDDEIGMLSVYQAKNTQALRKHADAAGLPIVDIFKARIAP